MNRAWDMLYILNLKIFQSYIHLHRIIYFIIYIIIFFYFVTSYIILSHYIIYFITYIIIFYNLYQNHFYNLYQKRNFEIALISLNENQKEHSTCLYFIKRILFKNFVYLKFCIKQNIY